MPVKILQLIFVNFLFINIVHSQAPPIQWQKCYGSSEGEFALRIESTNDGGSIVCGNADSTTNIPANGDITSYHGQRDFWIIKLDAAGAILWQKSFGGVDFEQANCIQQTMDGGYIVGGYTWSNNTGDVGVNHGRYDVWLVKLNNSGNIIWQKTYGGSNDEQAESIQQTNDGGYIVTGQTNSNDGDVTGNHGYIDIWVFKIDGTGNLVWQKTFGGTKIDEGRCIRQTTDGGYIFCGRTVSSDGDLNFNNGANYHSSYVVKLDAAGNITWQKTYGSSTPGEEAVGIVQTNDGGYVFSAVCKGNGGDVTGYHSGASDSGDFWIVKLNATGTLLWQKALGGSGDDNTFNLAQSQGGNIAVSGRSNSIDGDVTGNHGFFDFWLVELSGSGLLLWQKTLGGSDIDLGYGICPMVDGGYMATGQILSNNSGDVGSSHGGYSDIWVVKLAPTVSYSITNVSVCSSALPYTWNGNSYNEAGTYTVELTGSNGIDSIPTLNLSVQPSPAVQLDDVASVCIGKILKMDVSFPGATYLWQDGSTSPVYAISEEGVYWVKLNLNGCEKADTIAVNFQDCDCKLSIPNAITPNGDGINDQWIIGNHCDVPVKVSVYNRYGTLVYHSDNYHNDWKGTYGSKGCPDGTYFYVLQLPGQHQMLFKGNVTIIR